MTTTTTTTTPTTTLAWTYTTPSPPHSPLSSLRLRSTPLPPSTPSTLLVRVSAAALNPVDIQLLNLPLWRLPLLSTRPKGLGLDFAGTIVAAGTEAREQGYREGDEVMGVKFAVGAAPGTLAEVVSVDVGRGGCAAVVGRPGGWDAGMGAAVGVVWLTARTCVERVAGWVERADGGRGTVVVLGGSSATGLFVVWLAGRRGWRVVATCSEGRRGVVEGMGADAVVDYRREDVAGRVREVGPDAIVDCVGGTECLGIAPRYVTIVGDKTERGKMGGSLTYWWNPRMVARMLWGWLGWGEAYECVNLEVRRDWLEEVRELPREKVMVDSRFGWERVREALERLDGGRCVGKVVVEIGG